MTDIGFLTLRLITERTFTGGSLRWHGPRYPLLTGLMSRSWWSTPEERVRNSTSTSYTFWRRFSIPGRTIAWDISGRRIRWSSMTESTLASMSSTRIRRPVRRFIPNTTLTTRPFMGLARLTSRMPGLPRKSTVSRKARDLELLRYASCKVSCFPDLLRHSFVRHIVKVPGGDCNHLSKAPET